jgi:4-amino-4-deoxy-L-arabinose transferase-like glycosyltransferase
MSDTRHGPANPQMNARPTISGGNGDTVLSRLVAVARRRPGAVLAIVLGLHVLVWTLLPLLLCPNLQLDLAEDLAFGREWQLGYWKHPPLPWWAAELTYRITGQLDALYVLGPLAAAICFYAVWLLARDVAGRFSALLAVLALEGVHFYNFSVVKFAHDQVQLPFWAFTCLFFYRALVRGRLGDWALAGAFLAGAFWSKYAAFALAATLGLFLLFDPQARRAWRTPGPWVMALAFAIVIAPTAWWLVHNDFLPFQYVDARARTAAHWYQYVLYPLQWSGSQALALVPALAVLTLLYRRADICWPTPADGIAAFNRRYVTALALGPFLVTTAVAALLGRLPIAMWGYPLWSFAPLAVLLWLRPSDDPLRMRRFAAGAIAILLAFPIIYAAVEVGEPFVRDRPKATQFPGQAMAEAITRAWHDAYGTPIVYAGGTEFPVNNLAVYSPDRPHVLPHGNPKLAPWVDLNDLRRRGAVLVWDEDDPRVRLDDWQETFVQIDVQPTLVLARQTWFPVKPVRMIYAFVPPRP